MRALTVKEVDEVSGGSYLSDITDLATQTGVVGSIIGLQRLELQLVQPLEVGGVQVLELPGVLEQDLGPIFITDMSAA
ncbi:MAG: hypothetical protein P8J61_03025 [Gammaproteobacteria bacterium]|jgi:hypothetical protein|nr:hypothetical protein [Gammaproteobacteria bacterium]